MALWELVSEDEEVKHLSELTWDDPCARTLPSHTRRVFATEQEQGACEQQAQLHLSEGYKRDPSLEVFLGFLVPGSYVYHIITWSVVYMKSTHGGEGSQ